MFQGECEDISAKERGHTALSELCGHCVNMGCRNIGCNQIHLRLLPFAKVFPRYLLKVLVMVMGYGGPSCMRSASCFRRTLGSCILYSLLGTVRSTLDLCPKFLSIHIHKYSRSYSNILSDRREICCRVCSLFSKKQHLMGDLRDVTLSILVAWSHESSLS